MFYEIHHTIVDDVAEVNAAVGVVGRSLGKGDHRGPAQPGAGSQEPPGRRQVGSIRRIRFRHFP